MAAAALLGVVTWAAALSTWAAAKIPQQDLRSYYSAGHHITRGGALIYAPPRHGRVPFIYPPLAALPFHVFGRFAEAQTVMLWLTVAAVPAVLLACVQVLRRSRPDSAVARLGRPGQALLVFVGAGVALWSVPIESNLRTGQVNLFLALLVLGDVALPQRHPLKGVLIGLAAALKLTPGLFLVWYLFSGHRRACLRGGVTFLAGAALGAVVLPRASLAYWPHISELSARLEQYGWLLTRANQSIESVFLSLAGDSPLHRSVGTVLGVAVAAAALAVAVRLTRRGEELTAVVVCGVAAALMEPISWDHHWVWLVPGLVLLADLALAGPAWRWLWAAAYVLVFTQWALVVHALPPGFDLPKTWVRLAYEGPGPVFDSQLLGMLSDRALTVGGLVLLTAQIVRLGRRDLGVLPLRTARSR